MPGVANFFNPDGITEEELEALGESFSNNYDIDRKEIGPDRGVSIEGGKRFRFGDDFSAAGAARAGMEPAVTPRQHPGEYYAHEGASENAMRAIASLVDKS